MACGCPAGTRIASPRETSIGLSAARSRSSWASTRAGELVGLQTVAEADPDGGTRLGVEDEPGLGLAVVAVEVPGGEGAVGVRVDREPLTAVEQLGQQLRLDAEPGDVRGAEPALRVGRERVGSVVPSSSTVTPSPPSANRCVVEASQSSGRWPSKSSGTGRPRKARIRSPPR